jgi:hypothetical protein
VTSYFCAYQAAVMCVHNLVPVFIEHLLASLLCIATRAIVHCHLYLRVLIQSCFAPFISTVCVSVGLVTISTRTYLRCI